MSLAALTHLRSYCCPSQSEREQSLQIAAQLSAKTRYLNPSSAIDEANSNALVIPSSSLLQTSQQGPIFRVSRRISCCTLVLRLQATTPTPIPLPSIVEEASKQKAIVFVKAFSAIRLLCAFACSSLDSLETITEQGGFTS